MHEWERPLCEVWDLKVVPRGAVIRLSGRVYRGRGACKANASTRRFFALFTTEALRVTGVEQ